jgi:hypothetical protein
MSITKGSPRGGGTSADPTAAEYFDALPNGWSSFPTCLVRAELIASLSQRGVVTKDALPARLHHVLDVATEDARAMEWLPEVVHVTAMLAVRDARFGHGAQADSTFLSWMTQLNRELFSTSRHAAALSFNTPEDLVARLPDVWGAFRRGTRVVVEKSCAGSATFVLSHPPALFAPVCLESHRRAVAILLVKAGAVQPDVVTQTETHGDLARTTFVATWS